MLIFTRSPPRRAKFSAIELFDEDFDRAMRKLTRDRTPREAFRKAFRKAVDMVVRPARASYHPGQLGPAQFELGGAQFAREDSQVLSPRGLRLELSVWGRDGDGDGSEETTLVYAHSMSGSRLEALPLLPLALPLGLRVAAFDCAGAGLSEGECVSFGWHERGDLRAVLRALRARRVVLWGRGTGAAAVLMLLHPPAPRRGRVAAFWSRFSSDSAASRAALEGVLGGPLDGGDEKVGEEEGEEEQDLDLDQGPPADLDVRAVVLDSCYRSAETLIDDMLAAARAEGFALPRFVASAGVAMLRGSVQKRAGWDSRDLVPGAAAPLLRAPVLFAAAESDDFVRASNAEALFEAAAGAADRELLVVPGVHDSLRPDVFLDVTRGFLVRSLAVPAEEAALLPPPGAGPPWVPAAPRGHIVLSRTGPGAAGAGSGPAGAGAGAEAPPPPPPSPPPPLELPPPATPDAGAQQQQQQQRRPPCPLDDALARVRSQKCELQGSPIVAPSYGSPRSLRLGRKRYSRR